jgi:tetratricopeptide (TPR) repeat protein
MCWAMATEDVALVTALSFCDTADAHEPENFDVLDSRGFVLLRLKRYPESIAAYDAALKVYPNGETSLYGRGLAKRLSGQTEAGDADIRAALAIDATVSERFAWFGLRP